MGQTVSGYFALLDTPAHRPSQLFPVSVMTDYVNEILPRSDLFPGARCCAFKGATSQVSGSPAVLDQTVIILDQTDIVLDQTVIILDRTDIVLDRTVIVLLRTVITICGVLSFPSAWRWVRPSLVNSHYQTHQRTALPSLSCLSDDRYVRGSAALEPRLPHGPFFPVM